MGNVLKKTFQSSFSKTTLGAWFTLSVALVPLAYQSQAPVKCEFSIGTLALVISLTVLLILLVASYMVGQKKSLPPHLPSYAKRHPILIIDDNEFDLEKMADKLAGGGYNITKISALTDARLTEGYGIIICDIDGAGPIHDCIGVLKRLYSDYPYKIVYPVSTRKWDELPDTPILRKGRGDEYLKKLPELVEKGMQELNNPRDHWEKTAIVLKERHVPHNDISDMKNAFIRYIESISEK